MLYQLSYASPIHSGNLPGRLKKSADTLPLRTNYGTESKVSTGPPVEQTGSHVQKLESAGRHETRIDLTTLSTRGNLLAQTILNEEAP